MSGTPERYDVAVVGGGPAGSAAAVALARRGRDVVLLEASRYDDWRAGETFPPSIREPLAALGAAAEFDALETVPSDGIRSHWGATDAQVRSFLRTPQGRGWHVDRQAFDRMLGAAAERAGATVRRGTRATDPEFHADGSCSLGVEPAGRAADPSSLRADGLIDATGRTSALARRLGGRRDTRDRLVAAAVQLRADPGACGRYTLVEAAADGWWYSAPLPGERAVATWLTDADLLGDRRRLEPWRTAVDDAGPTAARLAEATVARGPEVAAATSFRLRRTVGTDRWLAVGDAAMGVDPLSGSGVQRALDTGVRGALAMDRWLDGDRDPVERYERRLDDAFEDYLDDWRAYYELETRWSERRFWRRRHE